MKLFLVRHGEATSKDQDPERPLTESGARSARKIAIMLGRARALQVAEIRHSTKLRAHQTAEIFAAQCASDARVTEMEGLEPTADVSAMAKQLSTADGDIMLVGHLPYLDRLASQLIAGDANREAFSFEASGVMCLARRDSNGGPKWTVEWMLNPNLLAE